MRGLLAILYLVAVGWAISHYELDKLCLEAAHKAARHLMREAAEISLEVHTEGLGRYELQRPVVLLVPAVPPFRES